MTCVCIATIYGRRLRIVYPHQTSSLNCWDDYDVLNNSFHYDLGNPKACTKKNETQQKGNGDKPAFPMHRPVHFCTIAPRAGALYQNCRLFSAYGVQKCFSRPGIDTDWGILYTTQIVHERGFLFFLCPQKGVRVCNSRIPCPQTGVLIQTLQQSRDRRKCPFLWDQFRMLPVTLLVTCDRSAEARLVTVTEIPRSVSDGITTAV